MLTVLIGFITMSFFSHASPKDNSVAAYEKFKQEADQEVNKTISEEFAIKEENIKKLSQPIKIGEEVTISLIQGDRQRVVTGKFKGLNGQYADVDGRNILLSDIEAIDQQRLMYADQAAVLQLKLNQLNKEMEEDKGRRREILLEAKYKQAGYTKKYFDNTVQLADRFWEMEALGDNALAFQISTASTNDLVRVELQNKHSDPLSMVLFFDKKPIYAKIARSEDKVSGDERNKSLTPVFILNKELGENFWAELKSNLRLWVVKPEVGNWYLQPTAESEPQSVTADKVLCKECYGSKTSVTPDHESIECPTCRGNGMVSGKEDQKVATYRFRILKSTIKTYSQANLREFAKFEQDIQPLYQQVEDYINDTKTKVRLAREENEQSEREKADKLKQEAEEKARNLAMLEQVEQNYLWLTAATAIRRNVDPIPSFKVKSTNELDDYNFPATFDGKSVTQFTDWIKISSKSRDLVGQKYRLIKVGKPSANPKYIIQYQLSFVNTGGTPMDFNTDVTVKFVNGEEQNWSDSFTSILPSWSGYIFGAHELTIDNLLHAIDTVSITAKN